MPWSIRVRACIPRPPFSSRDALVQADTSTAATGANCFSQLCAACRCSKCGTSPRRRLICFPQALNAMAAELGVGAGWMHADSAAPMFFDML